MTTTTDFVSRLVRAANEPHSLHPTEVKSLLDRSISVIADLRAEAGIVPIRGRDAIIYIKTVAAGVDRVPIDEWHHSLLHAAEMIRDLRVVLDTGTGINIIAKSFDAGV
ncbi:hypothetical protein [Pararhizobium arenae]|uniref:hypothetical protein n=1 Tax=Pararhizobium arenae TaxID=1856850 RepID=UPI00094B176A|nr:hypothetical protein [Pararhizobium arenae]